MRRRPRDPRSGIFMRSVVTLITVGGLWSTAVNLGLFAWAMHSGRSIEEAMTMTFVSLVLIQFFKAYNFRSDRHSMFHRPFANKWLNRAILWELVLLVLILYLPFMHRALGTFSLTGNGLDHHCHRSAHHLPGTGTGKVDGTARLVRQVELRLRWVLPHLLSVLWLKR